MKNKIFRKLILAVIFIFFLIINANIYAANFGVSLEIDNINKDEKSITLLLKIKDVNFENPLSTIEGNLDYDREIFSETKIENLNGWSIVYNNEEKAKGKFIGFKVSNEEIKQEDLCKITLKLKENLEDSSTKISINNVKSADGDNLVSTENKSINVDISDSAITTAQEEKNKITDKNILKYLLIIVELFLVLTVITSTAYLIQNHKIRKMYSKKNQKK